MQSLPAVGAFRAMLHAALPSEGQLGQTDREMASAQLPLMEVGGENFCWQCRTRVGLSASLGSPPKMTHFPCKNDSAGAR